MLLYVKHCFRNPEHGNSFSFVMQGTKESEKNCSVMDGDHDGEQIDISWVLVDIPCCVPSIAPYLSTNSTMTTTSSPTNWLSLSE